MGISEGDLNGIRRQTRMAIRLGQDTEGSPVETPSVSFAMNQSLHRMQQKGRMPGTSKKRSTEAAFLFELGRPRPGDGVGTTSSFPQVKSSSMSLTAASAEAKCLRLREGGEMIAFFPHVLGHEGSGIVVEVGNLT